MATRLRRVLAIGDKLRKNFSCEKGTFREYEGTVEDFEGEKVVVLWSDGYTTALKRADALKYRVGCAAAMDGLTEPEAEADEDPAEPEVEAEDPALAGVATKLDGVLAMETDSVGSAELRDDDLSDEEKKAEGGGSSEPAVVDDSEDDAELICRPKKSPSKSAAVPGEAALVEAARTERERAYTAHWGTTPPAVVQSKAAKVVQDAIAHGLECDDVVIAAASVVLPSDGYIRWVAAEAVRSGRTPIEVGAAVIKAGGIPEVANAVCAACVAYASMADSN